MPALEPGAAAPEFLLLDRQGGIHSLSQSLAQGPLLLVFFKISCPTCQYALPFFERLRTRLAHARASIWAVSQDSPDSTRAFQREFQVEALPMLFDSGAQDYPVSNAYGVTNVPTAFLIEPDGKIGLTAVGWSKADTESIALRLGQAAGQASLTLFEPRENIIAFRPG
jgi:peroxiredoxin